MTAAAAAAKKAAAVDSRRVDARRTQANMAVDVMRQLIDMLLEWDDALLRAHAAPIYAAMLHVVGAPCGTLVRHALVRLLTRLAVVANLMPAEAQQ
mmetsp:Transcript_32452/g.79423  ORF Transcript_32452/g.79423 Transcript_32452/m.79423 type:complete len:96 (+) Transcript_32452:3-290(+)